MKRIVIVAISALLLSSGGMAPGQEPNKEAPYAYRDNEGGLKRLIGDLIKARKQQDTSGYRNLVTTLILPKHNEWFDNTFGLDIGKQFAFEYPQDDAKFESILNKVFDEAISSNFTNVRVDRFVDECGPDIDADQYPVLALRKTRVPIYQVFLCDRSCTVGRRLWAFAHVDGAFRFLQDLHANRLVITFDPQIFTVSREALQAKLVHMENPVYPTDARNKHQQGSVQLGVIIDKSGAIKDIHVLEGTCQFSEAAINAVKKWRYEPILINGVAKEVASVVHVFFRLKSR
jgi:TonB family protein